VLPRNAVRCRHTFSECAARPDDKSALQCVAVCCSVCCSMLQCVADPPSQCVQQDPTARVCCSVLQRVLQCVAAYVAACCRALQTHLLSVCSKTQRQECVAPYVAACCSELQTHQLGVCSKTRRQECVAECCSVLQRVLQHVTVRGKLTNSVCAARPDSAKSNASLNNFSKVSSTVNLHCNLSGELIFENGNLIQPPHIKFH